MRTATHDILERGCYGKDVAIIGYGLSLEDLVQNIERLRDTELVWVSINTEDGANEILNRIGQKISFVTAYPKERQEQVYEAQPLKLCHDPVGGSLQTLLDQLKDIGAKRVFLFGCDGYSIQGKNHHLFAYKNHLGIMRSLKVDWGIMEKTFQNDPNMPIYNCSSQTQYTVFKKVTFDEVVNFLTGVSCEN